MTRFLIFLLFVLKFLCYLKFVFHYFWFVRLEVMELKHLGLEGKMEER